MLSSTVSCTSFFFFFLLRWTSHRAFLETFLFNYNFYLKIRDDEPNLFSANERKILDNRQIREGAAHMLDQLNIVTAGLNVMQSDSANLVDATNTWLSIATHPSLSEDIKESVEKRKQQAITPYHILAKLLHNHDQGPKLPLELKQQAMDYLEEIDESFLGIHAAYETEDTTVFPSTAFKQSIKNLLEPLKYWNYIKKNTELAPLQRFCDLANRIFSCPPSSAGIYLS